MNDPIELYGHDLSSLIFNMQNLLSDLQQHSTRIARNGRKMNRQLTECLLNDLRAVGEQCLVAAGHTVSVPIIDPYTTAK